MGAWLFMIMCC